MAVATLAAAAASVCILHSTRRQQKVGADETVDLVDCRNGFADAGDDRERSVGNDHRENLGIAEADLPGHVRREIHKERKRMSKMDMISLKTPMYDNVYMLDVDREPMCTISMKKARWYIRKNIAEWSSLKNSTNCTAAKKTDSKIGDEQDAKCIRLLFEHNGSSKDPSRSEEGILSSEALYLRSAKRNVCVACGRGGHIIRHYIVPYSYRSLMPPEYKSHMSHDIVILCPDCHLDCERHSKRRMKRMEDELREKDIMSTGAISRNDPVVDHPYLGHVRSCAIALIKWKDDMPNDRVELYEKVVRDYLISACRNDDERTTLPKGKEMTELTKSQLEKACNVNHRVKNPNYVSGSEIVVRSLKGDARLLGQFIVDWRKHFVDTVNPRHMPTGWRVDNPVVCGSKFVTLDRGIDGPPLRS
ncbi:hypothetical protein ACHAXA_005999 [Cyclostephanos tholiformis]|uniref:HNH domain-containing protein n=1 Tax=Cyclostephanos tholiformis TaxID=382380 RepID=A0ABD3SQQ0_9STRA